MMISIFESFVFFVFMFDLGQSPTIKPTMSPTYASCQWEFEVDIVFIVDTGCGIDEESQMYQQEFLTNLMQTIKRTPNPKISVIECNSFKPSIPLPLGDAIYNDLGKPGLSDGELKDLSNKFKTRREYVPGDKTPKKQCFENAIKEFEDNESGHLREKKVVLVSSCDEDDIDGNSTVCSLNDEIFGTGNNQNNIDVIVININFVSNVFECLINSDLKRIYNYDSFDELESNENQLLEIRAEICEKPTDGPTTSPSLGPTTTPTAGPTPSPLYRSCSWYYPADIIFIVDTSCGLTVYETRLQQNYLSDLIQLTKKNANPRIGIIECNHIFIHNKDMVYISLDDSIINSLVEDPTYDEIKDLYIGVKNRRVYNDGFQTTPKTRCLTEALRQFGDSDSDGDTLRQKKIVLLSNCPSDDEDTVCSIKDKLYSKTDNIQVIAINIGTNTKYGLNQNAYSCLVDNLFNELFVYPEFDMLQSNENILYSVRNVICQMPTISPSLSQSLLQHIHQQIHQHLHRLTNHHEDLQKDQLQNQPNFPQNNQHLILHRFQHHALHLVLATIHLQLHHSHQLQNQQENHHMHHLHFPLQHQHGHQLNFQLSPHRWLLQ